MLGTRRSVGPGRLFPALWVSALFYCQSVAKAEAGVTEVQFSRLSSVRLPYGEPVSISGTVGDLEKRIPDLTKWIQVQAVEVSYRTAADDPPKTARSRIEKEQRWRVLVGPFREGSAVTFELTVQGMLAAEASKNLLEALSKDERIQQLREEFFKAAVGRDESAVRLAADLFAEKTLEVFRGNLPAGYSLQGDGSKIAAGLFRSPEFVNLRNRLEDVKREAPELQGTPAEISDRIKACAQMVASGKEAPQCPKKEKLLDYNKKEGVLYDYVNDYEKARAAVGQIPLSATLEISTRILEAAMVKYLEKYAGADVASLWIPRLDEMRAFAVLHLYWGPIELSPSPAAEKKGEWLRQRFSLAFGYSLANVSSSHESKIRGNNVWFYGLGFRFNRYFRINAGGALYRGPAANSGLRNDFIVGPSLDLTALQYFRNVFAKADSGK